MKYWGENAKGVQGMPILATASVKFVERSAVAPPSKDFNDLMLTERFEGVPVLLERGTNAGQCPVSAVRQRFIRRFFDFFGFRSKNP